MKIASVDQFNSLVEDIIEDRGKQAKVSGQPFLGVTKGEMLSEIDKRVENGLVFVKEHPKFTKEDVDAVAKSRFYRKTGIRMLMLLIIAILAVMILATFRVIAPYVYYGLCGLSAVVFLYIYARKQREAIISLRQATNIRVVEPDKGKGKSRK